MGTNMHTTKALDTLIGDLKTASQGTGALDDIKSILASFVEDPKTAKENVPEYEEDDVILYEDDNISIWFCRFQPDVTVPPHDHQMSATIAVYSGIERNNFYERNGDQLTPSGQVDLEAGQVIQIAPDEVHGVTCASQEPSCAIHVYMGNLTIVERSLFDVANGKVMSFTDENYQKLTS